MTVTVTLRKDTGDSPLRAFPSIEKVQITQTKLKMKKTNGLRIAYQLDDILSFQVYPGGEIPS